MSKNQQATLANMLHTEMNFKNYTDNNPTQSKNETKEKKTEIIIIRVSKSEKEKISELAKDQALTPSQYIRTKILGKKE